jgi:hypothetical protein
MIIIGLDVGKNSVVCCPLETNSKPEDLKAYLRRNSNFINCKADAEGIQTLLEIPFDIAIIEPTGGHYSKIWAKTIEANGKEVRWVDHQAIANHRKSHRLPNKNDKADALALADYGIAHINKKEFFLTEPFNELRDKYLQLQSVNRAQNPVVNRLRQQLAHEWPEKQDYATSRNWGKEKPPSFWRYLAGEEIREKERKKYQQEKAESIGTGVSGFSSGLAAQICALERMEARIEEEIMPLLALEQYEPYKAAFAQLQFGPRLQTCILGNVYPFEKFLKNGRVHREHVRTSKGKRSRRNRSKAAFKLSIGCGMVEYQSGDKVVWKAGGPKQVRVELWRWVKTSIIMKAPTQPLTIELHRLYRAAKDAGVKDKIAIARTYTRAAGILFELLVKETQK